MNSYSENPPAEQSINEKIDALCAARGDAPGWRDTCARMAALAESDDLDAAGELASVQPVKPRWLAQGEYRQGEVIDREPAAPAPRALHREPTLDEMLADLDAYAAGIPDDEPESAPAPAVALNPSVPDAPAIDLDSTPVQPARHKIDPAYLAMIQEAHAKVRAWIEGERAINADIKRAERRIAAKKAGRVPGKIGRPATGTDGAAMTAAERKRRQRERDKLAGKRDVTAADRMREMRARKKRDVAA